MSSFVERTNRVRNTVRKAYETCEWVKAYAYETYGPPLGGRTFVRTSDRTNHGPLISAVVDVYRFCEELSAGLYLTIIERFIVQPAQWAHAINHRTVKRFCGWKNVGYQHVTKIIAFDITIRFCQQRNSPLICIDERKLAGELCSENLQLSCDSRQKWEFGCAQIVKYHYKLFFVDDRVFAKRFEGLNHRQYSSRTQFDVSGNCQPKRFCACRILFFRKPSRFQTNPNCRAYRCKRQKSADTGYHRLPEYAFVCSHRISHRNVHRTSLAAEVRGRES